MSCENERLEALKQICLECGVAALYAFGSRAREVSDWLTGVRPELEPSLAARRSRLLAAATKSAKHLKRRNPEALLSMGKE